MGALIGDARVKRALETLKGNIASAVAKMPSHRQFLERYCAPVTA
jgi:tryptophan halogenase